jgi:hypothetical protein
MTLPIFPILVTAVVLFFVVPQLAKFRATLGVPTVLSSDTLTILQRIGLLLLGLKAPFLNTLALAWSFILAEGGDLSGFAWESIVSHEHAAWIAFGLWATSLWAHFTGLNTAAATPPVITPLPTAIPVSPATPKA